MPTIALNDQPALDARTRIEIARRKSARIATGRRSRNINIVLGDITTRAMRIIPTGAKGERRAN